MKLFKRNFFISGMMALFFYGCASIPALNVSPTTHKCSTPLADFHITSITPLQNDLNVSPNFIKNLLTQASNEGCFTLDKVTDDSYNVEITYETTFQTDSEQKIATSSSQTLINAQVKISLKNTTATKTFNGKSSVQISSKKILDIGADAQIKQADKVQVITEAFKAAYDSAVQNFR